MGTRNITKIIYQGEVKVCQYGQWDGYPTTAMADIVEFLKQKDRVDTLLSVLPKVHLCNTPEEYQPHSLSNEIFEKIYRLLHDYKLVNDDGVTLKTYLDLTFDERINHVIINSSISREDSFRYQLETRDTGYQIMKALTTFAATRAESIPLISYQDIWDDWDIEAKYVIDFDAGTLTAWWHGVERTYPFDQLPEMLEMESLEKEGYEK